MIRRVTGVFTFAKLVTTASSCMKDRLRLQCRVSTVTDIHPFPDPNLYNKFTGFTSRLPLKRKVRVQTSYFCWPTLGPIPQHLGKLLVYAAHILSWWLEFLVPRDRHICAGFHNIRDTEDSTGISTASLCQLDLWICKQRYAVVSAFMLTDPNGTYEFLPKTL
jgi:hypothetical protein